MVEKYIFDNRYLNAYNVYYVKYSKLMIGIK